MRFGKVSGGGVGHMVDAVGTTAYAYTSGETPLSEPAAALT